MEKGTDEALDLLFKLSLLKEVQQYLNKICLRKTYV